MAKQPRQTFPYEEIKNIPMGQFDAKCKRCWNKKADGSWKKACDCRFWGCFYNKYPEAVGL
jgi:hypothetical protein